MKTEKEVLLEVKNLKQYFHVKTKTGEKTIHAVDNISFKLYKGETLGLVGESGSGKSTALRAISHLYEPTAGQVIFEGNDLAKLSSKELLSVRQNIQMVFQDPYSSLDPRMTVEQLISEPLCIYKKRKLLTISFREMNSRVDYLMNLVQLSPTFRNRYPHEFSGGQRQRIGIARALALNPRLLLLDEPVSALDVSVQTQILNLLVDLQNELSLTYLFIAHNLSVVRYISDRIAVMYLGKIVELSDSNTIYHSPEHPYTQALLSAIPVPDPNIEKKKKRVILSGETPSPYEIPPGCCFYDRCPKRFDFCHNNKPKLFEHAKTHKTACFLFHKEIEK